MVEPSPLLRFRSIASIDIHSQNKTYNVAIAVRQNGRWEVYADFMLVYVSYDIKMQCVDVLTDFNCFYLKFVKGSHLIRERVAVDSLKTHVRQVRHKWRNRISWDTTKKKKDKSLWDIIVHKRVSHYFNIFSQIINYQIYMLVAHRNMISVFNMTSKNVML